MTLSPNTPLSAENEIWSVGSWVSPKFDLSGRGERDTIRAGELVQITSVVNEGFAPVIRVCGMSKGWLCHAFTYIGPDLGDGWIGWSGGECPVADDMMATIRRKDGSEDTERADWWTWNSEYAPIIAFRPALSPPAEGERPRTGIAPLAPDDFARLVEACENPKPASEELKARLRDARRITTPTPAPVDWNVVGPKLVEAGYAFADHELASDWRTWSDERTRRLLGVGGRAEAFIDFRAALAAAQPEAK